jgi:polyphenol oxidase
MFYINKNGLVLAQFHCYSQLKGLSHFVTTRQGGVSTGAYASLNLSLREPDRNNAVKNRLLLANALEIGERRLLFPSQCHSDNIQIVDGETCTESLGQTDGLITASKGIFISVLVADCVPVLLYDTRQRVAGVVHAGWRGTVSLITAKIVDVFRNEFNSRTSDIVAAIGPSISLENYEVGEDVADMIRQNFDWSNRLIKPSVVPGKSYFDLWMANRLLLLHSGVPEDNIETAEICTFDNADSFFSARKLGPNSGRFGAGIMIDPLS